ncbi:Mur ligase family protein [Limnobacter sp.]|uniref:Mur ligase family protein n=1 Tax=Limnobacter sp. TaxID=2003368 RepID=UPI003516BD3E
MNTPLAALEHYFFNNVAQASHGTGLPVCVLALSCTNGTQRATTSHWVAADAQAAWPALLSKVEQCLGTQPKQPVQLRIDVVSHVEKTTWGVLKHRLANTKRNYFRLGIALDPHFKQVFLEAEINANCVLLGPSTVPSAQLNVDHFNRLGRIKFGEGFSLTHHDDQPVWLFKTAGMYWQTGMEQPVTLHADGPLTGARVLPPLDAEASANLIAEGSGFLQRQVQSDGRFVYGLFPCFDKEVPSYNTLRHASTVYAMLEAWELTRSAPLMEAIERALNCLITQLIVRKTLPGVEPAQEVAFLEDTGGEIKLGGNAVALLALCKYMELTGDQGHMPLAKQLAHGMAAMFNPQTQKFVHVLNSSDLSIKQAFRIVYYDGEACFALLRLYKLTRAPAYLSIVEQAFEYFIKAGHDQTHDHWLSYCVNELTIYKPLQKYFEFGIRNFSSYLDFVLERITTFPTLLELMMAAETMLQRMHKEPSLHALLATVNIEKFYRALHHRANYLRSGFFWPEWAMFFKNPQRLRGGFFIRHHSFRVRIDDVEHYLSGLVAYHKFLTQRVPLVGHANSVNEVSGDLPVYAVHLPADLRSQLNGALDPGLLTEIRGGKLHHIAARQWSAMCMAAERLGVVLSPLSVADTYRSFALQVRIFMDRYEVCSEGAIGAVVWQGRQWQLKSGKTPCELPGHDTHGLGLSVVIALDRGGRVLAWLRQYATLFGFCWLAGGSAARLVYFAGDNVLDVKPTAPLNMEQFESWSAEFISRSTPGQWVIKPPDGWQATGLSAWAGSAEDGHVVMVGNQQDVRGVKLPWLIKSGLKPSALIVCNTTVNELHGTPLQETPVYAVSDLQSALTDLAYAARRMFQGKVIAVTGSAGKSTTVSMLAHGLRPIDQDVYSTKSNANLPFGVAWNICQVKWAARFSVFELAVGSMPENSRLARPDVAVITNIGPSHLEYHGTTKNIALKKAKIFMGVPSGGAAVICHDTEYAMLLMREAETQGLRVLSYGIHPEATIRVELSADSSTTWVGPWTIYSPQGAVQLNLQSGGKHRVMNALACLGVALALGENLQRMADALADVQPLPGRGRYYKFDIEGRSIALIDESYNANPLSMSAAIEQANTSFQRGAFKRNVMLLGDMLELGPDATRHHMELLPLIARCKPDLVLLCGPQIACLEQPLVEVGLKCVKHFHSIDQLLDKYPAGLEDGDHVLVKASNGVGLHRWVAHLLDQQAS